MKKSLKEVLLVACDISPSTGEGSIYHSIKKRLENDHHITTYSDKFTTLSRKYKFLQDRVLPLYLVISTLLIRKKYSKIIFVNYLPLWAFWGGLLERAGVILGPITGSIGIVPHKKSWLMNLKRRLIQNTMVNINCLLLKKEKIKWAATPSVYKSLISKGFLNVFFCPPLLIELNLKKNKITKYDIFIYSGNHEIKNHEYVEKLINAIIQTERFSIVYVGPDAWKYSEHKLVTGFAYLSQKKFEDYLASSKCYISLSYEDAGVTMLKAFELGLNIICPSGYGFCSSKYADCLELDSIENTGYIIKHLNYATTNKINSNMKYILFKKKSKDYFKKWLLNDEN